MENLIEAVEAYLNATPEKLRGPLCIAMLEALPGAKTDLQNMKAAAAEPKPTA